MKWIKGSSSKILRDTFLQLSKMTNFWTRSYFVSTAWNVSSLTIKNYINIQKTRMHENDWIVYETNEIAQKRIISIWSTEGEALDIILN